MISGDPLVPGAAAVEEAKAYARVVGVDEDALIGRLTASAAELCERFTGQALIARGFSETLAVSSAWMRLAATPVEAITGVEELSGADAAAMPADAYAIDIDANGDGWVRIIEAGEATRIRVSYRAGLAAEWRGLPEALRQGAARLATHFFTHRDAAEGGAPPAAVTALWRPWRRMSLGGGRRHV
jgi:uncharacterized phiE125 gp8 family phage protein